MKFDQVPGFGRSEQRETAPGDQSEIRPVLGRWSLGPLRPPGHYMLDLPCRCWQETAICRHSSGDAGDWR